MSQLPDTCTIALKEWATVLEAMARGEQLVLIRKGGLIEPGSGFELAAPVFLFYPTFEHQAVQYLRPEFRHYFDEAVKHRLPALSAVPSGTGQAGAPEGQVRMDLIGLAVSSVQSNDPSIVERLSRFHIYNEVFLNQRLKWQPDQPLTIVVVRAFRLAASRLLPVVPRYAGCKSWVDLESPVALDGAQPVLDGATFERRLQDLTPVLNSGVGG